jgi:DNA helicase-2/ATP-dependent DNA helicase PcrA
LTPPFSQTDLKRELNEAQYRAVASTAPALLVLAGAGSGKTRVITYRIARLLEEGIRPEQILAVTFTNKAAGEMRSRIERLAGPDAKRLWMSTFHSICARLLRREFAAFGRPADFAIYAPEDCEGVLRECQRELDISTKDFPPRQIHGTLSYLKNHLLGPEEAGQAMGALRHRSGSPYADAVMKVYPEYEKRLRAANALDFDDLLLYPLRLFQDHPAILEKYRRRFRHILVDEYQDTNRAQYEFTRFLGKGADSVCVVGDDDQSIYRWRGALPENLEKFKKDFAPVEIVALEENYRSTAPILEAATAVVNANPRRNPKRLIARMEGKEPVWLLASADDDAEAEKVVALLDRWTQNTKEFSLGECAIFFRTAAQSRAIEEVLMRRGIPYALVGGIRFYERKEVKDILAYARAALNPRDEQALRRIVGLGHWSVGPRTLDQALELADRLGVTVLELPEEQLASAMRGRNATVFARFQQALRHWRGLLGGSELSLSVWFHRVIQESKYLEHLEASTSDREAKRQLENTKENLEQLVSAAGDFRDQLLASLEEHQTGMPLLNELELFLAQCSLMSDIDYLPGSEKSTAETSDPGKVTLMTLHSAKGLEFPLVFIVGCEEELLPHSRSSETQEGIEEERRLLYVGMTRAEKRLVLSYALTRRVFGRTASRLQSRFLREIPPECLQRVDSQPAESPQREDSLRRGDRVLHQVFGQGQVLLVSGRGDAQKVEVDFPKYGRKILMQAYAKMRKV